MSAPALILAHADAQFGRHLDRVQRFVRQPSVSATGEGMAEMAALVAEEIRALGGESEIIPTAGWPVVYGHIDEGQLRTLLVYGMYDVQPVAGETRCVPPHAGEIVDLPELGPSVVSRGVRQP